MEWLFTDGVPALVLAAAALSLGVVARATGWATASRAAVALVRAAARVLGLGQAPAPSRSSSKRPTGRCPLASVRASIAGARGAAAIEASCAPSDDNAAVNEWLESLKHQKPDGTN